MDTQLTNYPNKTHKQLLYFEKRKQFQKKFSSQIVLKNQHFWEEKYFFVFRLKFRTNKKSYQKSRALCFLEYP